MITSPFGHILLICVGFILRIAQYLSNRALWLDEIPIASSLISRSYVDLLKPLDNGQLAPFGFLWADKFFMDFLGPHELGLRLFPLVCGLLSVIIFYLICQKNFSNEVTSVALALFVLNGPLIYFSSELKPYICDVLVSLCFFYPGLKIIKMKDVKPIHFVLLALAGGLSVWFSYPSVFVLAALAIALIKPKDFKHQLSLGALTLVWLASFFGLHYLTRLNMDQGVSQMYQNYWNEYFVKIISLNIWDFRSSLTHLLNTFKDPAGFYFVGLALAFAIVGVIYIARENLRVCMLWAGPILMALLASQLEKYPFVERLILFLVPSYILFVAVGLNHVLAQTKKAVPVFSAICIILIFVHPALSSAYHLAKPRTREEIKPILHYLQKNLQKDDLVYVEYYGFKTIAFYAKEYGLDAKNFIIGQQNKTLDNLKDDVQRFRGKRVWILFPHYRYESERGEEVLFTSLLDLFGKREYTMEKPGKRYMFYDGRTVGSVLYLYSM